jgi:MFS family permease
VSYAWLMVAITFLTHFLAMGFVFYSAGVFLLPLQEEFDVGRTEIALIGSIMSIGGAVVAPFIGRWVATGSIRFAMTLGCLCLGVAFLAGSRATELWHLFVVFGPFATLGMSTMGGVTTQALVVNWFEEDRAMALGISMVGISASGFVIPPIATALTQAEGWRYAYEMFGLASLAITPIVFFTVVSRPEEREARKANAEEPVFRPAPDGAEFSTRDALRERNLWTIAIASGLSFMVTGAIMLHIAAAGIGAGLSENRAAFLISAAAVGAATAKIAFGWLAGKIGELRAVQIAFAAQGLGVLALNFTTGFEPFIAAAAVAGLGLGGVAPLAAALLARAFGQAAFGPMMGLMTPIMIPFQASGAPIAGGIYDTTNRYELAWYAGTVVMLCAIVVVSLLRLPGDEPLAAVGAEAQPAESS